MPTPRLAPLRCASWDSDNEVVVMFGGEGSREGTLIYDFKANEWRDLQPATMPPTDKNDAVLTYDPFNKIVLAIVKITEESEENAKHRLETWAFDASANKWTKLNPAREPDASGNRARNLMFAPEDVVGYHVERAPAEVLTEDQLKRLKKQTPPLAEPSVGAIKRIGQFKRLTSAPVREPKFIDTTIDLSKRGPISGESIYERNFNSEQFDESGKSYRFTVFAYRVHAVDARGTESGPSPAVFTIPSSPQWAFAKEEGTKCRLKWSANPEKGIQGYRVYRMNGRYDKDAIVRLTADPISGLAHSDTEAGKASRRYYVVAVDALGQEGCPSAPVWFEREWKKFYEPFVAEWHQ